MIGKRGWVKTDDEVKSFARENEEIFNKGAYFNLMQQLNRLAKHSKGLSLTSQRQYYNHMDQFVRFLADDYGVQNLANFSGRHVAEYVEDRQCEGKSAVTVKNDLAGIRYFHDQFLGETRHRIPDNKGLQERFGVLLERRAFGGVNRRWTRSEMNKMIDLAFRKNRHDVAQMIQLGAGMGLRIHEAVRLSRLDAENALRAGMLHVKGKGGLEREVPLREGMADLLRAIMAPVPRGQKLFVSEQRRAHEVIQSVQSFIINHRDKVEDPGARPQGVHMTFHGLRHAYAYGRFLEFIQQGFAPATARLKVAMLIGHSREDVTRIYLAE